MTRVCGPVAGLGSLCGPVGKKDWQVLRLDPASGELTAPIERAGVDEASCAASAVAAHGRLFTTVRGDNRVLYQDLSAD